MVVILHSPVKGLLYLFSYLGLVFPLNVITVKRLRHELETKCVRDSINDNGFILQIHVDSISITTAWHDWK